MIGTSSWIWQTLSNGGRIHEEASNGGQASTLLSSSSEKESSCWKVGHPASEIVRELGIARNQLCKWQTELRARKHMIEWDTGRAIMHLSLVGYDPVALTNDPFTNRAERFSFYQVLSLTSTAR